MTSAAYRYTATALPGGIVTLGLMLFMVALVATTYQDPPQDPARIPLSAIFPPDAVPKEFPKPVKPPKMDEVAKAPDNARMFPGIQDPIGIDGGDPITYDRETTVIVPTAIDSNYIPVYVPQPRFPIKALQRGVSGYAVVAVTITTTGGVRVPSIVEEYPEGYGFGKEAIKAAERMKYSPKMVDGNPVEVPGVMYKFSFSMEE